MSNAAPARAFNAARQTTPKTARRIGRWPIGAWVCFAIIAVFFLVPILYLIVTALKTQAEYAANPVGMVQDPHFENFAAAWVQGKFGSQILNTMVYTLCGALSSTVLSVLLGFPLARGYIGHEKFWTGMLASFLFLPNALVPQFQLLFRTGLYNTQLGYIIMCAVNLGIGPMLFVGYAKSIPRELDEAAALEGCGYWRYLLRFVLPMSRPAILTIFILDCVWIWNDFILAQVIFSDTSKWPIATGLNAFKGIYSTDWPLLAAATVIVALPLIALYIFIQKYLVNGVTGAVKG
ncbi:MAG: carbohydrate ABC transporter permease [Propionibacteriaceae bacterium]|jgi:raffinose/stachyose/melibiose transport system permease protein|nr:carbohydrate ABC transporter permease [Propionibacteriaceae bacterium]